jgi:hypothetical protein
LDEELTTPHCIIISWIRNVTQGLKFERILWNDQGNEKFIQDLEYEILRVYRVGSLKTVAIQLAKYNLNVGEVQDVKWVGGGGQLADDYTLRDRLSCT